MFIENVKDLRATDVLDDELFMELFAIQSDFEREKKYLEIEQKASELKVKTQFIRCYKAFKKEYKKARFEVMASDNPSYITEFEGQPTLRCGVWRANESGIWTLSNKGMLMACAHPIFPRTILVNAETNTCKVEICFKVRGSWRTAYVDRKTIASRSSIIALADNGVQVTSENAGALVQYLSDVEALNEDVIIEKTSTSRLGWIGSTFMPYGDDIIFDNEQNLVALFNSIAQVGSRDRWYECVKELRKEGRIEVLIYIAASLASVLVEPCGALPFIVDLWGETGKGKTVALMIATSVWADPNEGAYMSDAKATTTAMEVRLNILNSLPMTLDDMAQIKNQYDGDFSDLVYRWCAGKGKDRSNTKLGLNKLTSWHNCIITNAEHSLVTETMQGGAINRIIDVEMGDGYIFKDGNHVAEVMRNNYGYCGREFVELLQLIGFEEIRKIQKEYVEKIKEFAKSLGEEKEEKQIIPMSLLLTADEIAEKYLFKDGVRLDMRTCCDLLKNRGEVSEHKRAYEYIKETVVSNTFRFSNEVDERVEKWGRFVGSNQKVAIMGKFFDKIMKESGFQTKAFLSWAKKNGAIETDNAGNVKKLFSFDGLKMRCVVFNMDWHDPGEILEEDNPFD